MKNEIEISGDSSKCAGLFTYSALAKGGSLLWYLVPTSTAIFGDFTKYPLHHQNVPISPNKQVQGL